MPKRKLFDDFDAPKPKHLYHTSGDHLVLMGNPARFTTAVEP